MGLKGDGFIGIPLHDMCNAINVFPYSLILTAMHFYIQSGMSVFGTIKCGSVDVVRNGEKYKRKNGAYR